MLFDLYFVTFLSLSDEISQNSNFVIVVLIKVKPIPMAKSNLKQIVI